ncbi:MAG TPA: T9SS type A sorting domain-containing protein [Chitinophagales bacterium]|nr:T9SS type A sorting domain-containing protein [Chitinophagales bacterium]
MYQKLLAYLVILAITPTLLMANWENKSFEMDGYLREYRVYTPQDYDPSKTYSLVVGIHGLGDNMVNFSNILREFSFIADTADIILAYPQGLPNFLLGTGWNSGAGMLGIYPSEFVDDVAFINAVTDSMQTNYSIVKEQTYLFGFSNGGYMVQKIACESNDRYAAIASIAGTLGNKIKSCNPERKIPILHFHGTADINVNYYNPPMGKSVSSLMRLWSGNYNCSEYEVIKLPDTQSDGYTVEHHIYKDCDERLELFKVNNAMHIILNRTNDISYSDEMWKFFSYKKDTSITTGVRNHQSNHINIYPNPAQDIVKINLQNFERPHQLVVSIWDYTGKKIQNLTNNLSGDYLLDCRNFPNGIYLIIAQDEHRYLSSKFIVNR